MSFEWKIIIDELEGILTGEPIDATNPEVTAVSIDANSEEDITAGAKVSILN